MARKRYNPDEINEDLILPQMDAPFILGINNSTIGCIILSKTNY